MDDFLQEPIASDDLDIDARLIFIAPVIAELIRDIGEFVDGAEKASGGYELEG